MAKKGWMAIKGMHFEWELDKNQAEPQVGREEQTPLLRTREFSDPFPPNKNFSVLGEHTEAP